MSTEPQSSPESLPESRTCRKCNETKIVSPETWVYRAKGNGTARRYQAHGLLCSACDNQRKKVYQQRRDEFRLIGTPAKQAKSEKPDPAKDRKAALAQNRLDVAAALKTGGVVLNQFAPAVMARLIEYLEDPDHPHHLWALEFLAQRLLPRKLYEELGGQAAGVGGLSDKRPVYQINIHPAGPAAEAGRIVSVQPSPALPGVADAEILSTDEGANDEDPA